ncbi:hypothetical protein A1O1_08462 [Capronia coronata CBS 617.96]|uniref:DASH complex subunit DAD1 n=1 Tax=Capronia coronata CBS 617.96 TaxID=1182541 RepID=W9YDB2_9EURO|nr:uncharacterized protein A1O1_08462 [Capronia coronata CBS 617.96]EXJ80319.1 hypothetical protein A1O1_08462 [Capronia coronata CBS 617.96]
MTTRHLSNAAENNQHESSEFEIRRAAFVGEIGESLEQVLVQINALNRSLEGIIEIGNEFSSVEALWSQFETVMGREDDNAQAQPATGQEQESSTRDHGHGEHS